MNTRLESKLNRLKIQKNDPTKAGQRASKVVTFGDLSRYAVYAVHTRFDTTCWFVTDIENLDEHDLPRVIRQHIGNVGVAIQGLE